MSATVVALALSAAILHASWNAFLRTGGDRPTTITVMSLSGIVVGLPFAVVYPLPDPSARRGRSPRCAKPASFSQP